MTIVCALFDPEKNEVWLGCNDRGTIGDMPAPNAASKWLTLGDWAIAMSGESVYESFVVSAAEHFPETSASPLDVFKFFRSTFEDAHLGEKKGGDTSPSYGVDGILAHKSGKVWDFDHRLAMSEIPPGRLWAGGSGVDFALGADFAMKDMNLGPRERVERAVKAAIAMDVGCPGKPLVELFPSPQEGKT